MLKNKFTYLLGFSAFVLVTTAAFFSVTGLAKLFSGAYWSVIIMISGLELAKLVSTSYLYRYWREIKLSLKVYMVIGVVVLMIITSIGVYGFLSAAFSDTSNKVNSVDNKITLLEGKKRFFEESSSRIKSLIDNKSIRINNLNSLRSNQESRIDTLYKKNLISRVKQAEQAIRDANNEIEQTNKQIESLSIQIQPFIDSISKTDLLILELKSNDIKGDIGPLKYMATLTGKRIEEVVNILILFLIFVFDPLAVCLVIATNRMLLKEVDVKKEALTNIRDFAERTTQREVDEFHKGNHHIVDDRNFTLNPLTQKEVEEVFSAMQKASQKFHNGYQPVTDNTSNQPPQDSSQTNSEDKLSSFGLPYPEEQVRYGSSLNNPPLSWDEAIENIKNKKQEKEMKANLLVDKSLSTRDNILKNYLQVCKDASEKSDVFIKFKSEPAYKEVLEHLSVRLGQKHLESICKLKLDWLLDVTSIWENDTYGNPELYLHGVSEKLQFSCSPTTMQYLSVVANLIHYFGSLDKWDIIEIGGGYGGQCKVLQDVFEVNSYDIIDLEEAGMLQRKYLSTLNVKSFRTFSPSFKMSDNTSYDLVISNYALTEVSIEDQDSYVKNILLNAKHGYITCNQPLSSMHLLQEKFSTFKISKDIEGERETNFLITW